MANQLKVAKVLSIRTLHDQGWSQRRIARELGVHRDTVARHLKKNAESGEAAPRPGDSKPAKAPPGSETDQHDSKPAGH